MTCYLITHIGNFTFYLVQYSVACLLGHNSLILRLIFYRDKEYNDFKTGDIIIGTIAVILTLPYPII